MAKSTRRIWAGYYTFLACLEEPAAEDTPDERRDCFEQLTGDDPWSELRAEAGAARKQREEKGI
jgi:hypothetical protein